MVSYWWIALALLLGLAACSSEDTSTTAPTSTGTSTGSGGSGATSAAGGGGSGGVAGQGGEAGAGLLPEQADYYLAPDGDDETGDGSLDHPWHTINKVWTVVAAGELVYLRGGTYEMSSPQRLTGVSGEAGSLIRVWAYPGEHPIITKGASYPTSGYQETLGIYFEGDYVHFKGLEITGFAQMPDADYVTSGLWAESSNHCIFEQLDVHHNGHGMRLAQASGDNLVLNCDFHDNQDPYTSADPYGDADGLEITYVPEGMTNVVRGCRFWWNTDDGIDLIDNASAVRVEQCWSWYNGYAPGTFDPAGNGNGFKLGGATGDYYESTLRTVSNCVAFANRANGFDQNMATFRLELYNDTAHANAGTGFCVDQVAGIAHVLRNDVSWDNDTGELAIEDAAVHDHNSWNGGVTVAADDFASLDAAQLDDPRQADGSLPAIDFLHLTAGSDLVDSGVDVGQPYQGAAPDLGAFERE